MITLVFALLALLATARATDLCIDSIKNNVITYRRLDESMIEKRLFSLRDEQNMARLVLGVSIELTVVAANATDEDQQFKYYAARNSLLLILDSQVFDSLTFGVLSYAERTLTVPMTLLTTEICPNEDVAAIEIPLSVILQSALATFDITYIKLIHQLQQESSISAVRSTGILVYLSTTALSMLTVFFVLPVCVKCISTVHLRRQHADARFSVNEHARLIGIYFVSMCYAVVYCGYWIVEMTNYVLTDAVSQIQQAVVSPFLVNFLFVVLMSVTSMVMTIVFALKHKHSLKLKPLYKIFIYTGTACMVMLLTCTFYHGFFLIIAIAIDFTTAINGILYFSTLILAIYCSVPIILKQFHFSRKTKSCKTFLSTIAVLMFVLTFFCILMDELSISSNNNYTSDLPQLATTAVLSFITLAMIGAIGVIVEKKDSKKTAAPKIDSKNIAAPKIDSKNTAAPKIDSKKTAAPKIDNAKMEDPDEQHEASEEHKVDDHVVKHSKPFQLGGTERSVPRLVFIMCSNPGTLMAILQHSLQQTIPREVKI